MEDQQTQNSTNQPLQQVPEQQVQMPPPVMQQDEPKRKKTGLILAIVIPIILILLAGASLLLFLLFWNPQKSVSTKFMKAVTTGDTQSAISLTDGASANSAFIASAISGTRGSFNLEDSKKSDGKSYFLYSLSNPTNKYARTIVEKKSGQFLITSFVFTSGSLALVPQSGSVDSPDTDTNVDSSTNKCLVPSDAKGSLGYDLPVQTERISSQVDVFFKSNSLEYEYPSVTAKDIDKLALFYQQNSSKSFEFEFSGSVSIQQYTQAGIEFAKQRAEKVSNDLASKGVPQSYLRIGETVKRNPTGEDWQRRVGVKILSTCSDTVD